MKDLANRQLRAVVDGDFVHLSSDLSRLVEASQVLEILEDLPKADTVCKGISKASKQIASVDQAEQLYHLSELQRMYKCDTLSKVPSQAESLLASFASTNVDDIYFASLLSEQKNVKAGKDISKAIADATKNTVSTSFNKTNWAYGTQGFSVQSLRAAYLLNATKDEEFSKAV